VSSPGFLCFLSGQLLIWVLQGAARSDQSVKEVEDRVRGQPDDLGDLVHRIKGHHLDRGGSAEVREDHQVPYHFT
jgi:hypothetical protein